MLLTTPLVLLLTRRLARAAREREGLLQAAVRASDAERLRIARDLHDGVVQDLAGSSYTLSTVAARPTVDDGVRQELDGVGRSLRTSMRSLRSLLVEIYPPNLERAGLAPALADLATRLRPRGIDVRTSVPDGLGLPLETATLLFRTAQEALLNVVKHARASQVDVVVSESPGILQMDIADDGVGFDVASALSAPRSGHLGLCVLADLAGAHRATLDIRTGPGIGTHLRLRVPRP